MSRPGTMPKEYVDDLYVKEAEQTGGMWFNPGAEKLGLKDASRVSQRAAFLNHCGPDGKHPMQWQQDAPTWLYAMILTVTASVTAMLKGADRATLDTFFKSVLRPAADVLVKKLEESVWVRKQEGGKELAVKADLVALTAMHTFTRKGDLAPHAHVKCWRFGATDEGEVRSLRERRVFYRKFRDAALAAQVAIAAGMEQHLGVAMEMKNGKAEVRGIDPAFVKMVTGAAKRDMEQYLHDRQIPVTEVSLCYAAMNVRPDKKEWKLDERIPRWNQEVHAAIRQYEEARLAKEARRPGPEPKAGPTPEAGHHEAKQEGPKAEARRAPDDDAGSAQRQGQAEQRERRQLWETVAPGTRLMAHDVKPANQGTVVQDLGDKVRMHFVNREEQTEATVTIGKDKLTHMDGRALNVEPDPTRGPDGPGAWTSPGAQAARQQQAASAQGQAQQQTQQQKARPAYSYTPADGPSQPQAQQGQAAPEPGRFATLLKALVKEHVVEPLRSAKRVVEKAFFQHEGVVKVNDVGAFLQDTGPRPRHECRRAARRAVRTAPSISFSPWETMWGLLGIAQEAYAKAREPRFQPPKYTAIVVSAKAAAAMTAKQRKALKSRAAKNGWVLRIGDKTISPKQKRGQSQGQQHQSP